MNHLDLTKQVVPQKLGDVSVGTIKEFVYETYVPKETKKQPLILLVRDYLKLKDGAVEEVNIWGKYYEVTLFSQVAYVEFPQEIRGISYENWCKHFGNEVITQREFKELVKPSNLWAYPLVDLINFEDL